MQSALGRYQLKKLNDWVKKRRKNANFLNKVFKQYPNQFTMVNIQKECYHSMYRYYVFINFKGFKKEWNKEKILNFLIKKNISCSEGSCSEVYLEKCFKNIKEYKSLKLNNASSLSKSSLAFAVHPTMTRKELLIVSKNIKKLVLISRYNG